MKEKNVLKIVVLLVAILLVSVISFIGIYKHDKGEMKNILPDYVLGKEINGSRLITLKVDTSTKEANSKENTEETSENEEESTNETAKVPVNAEEVLTKENYEKTKKIIEQRLKDVKLSEYDIRLNNEDGTIILDMPESTQTDDVLQFLTDKGDFSIVSYDTNEVLLSKENLKEVSVRYYNSEKGTRVYLNIEFNSEYAKKLEDITKEYIETTDADGKETQKKVSIKIDDETLLTTYFGETISTGSIQLPIGTETTDMDTLNEYVKSCSFIATLLNSDTMPIVYTVDFNQYISATIDGKMVNTIIIAMGIILAIIVICLFIKYDLNGVLAGIAIIGYVALTMLLIRFTNVPLSIGSMAAVLLSIIVQIIFVKQLLKNTTIQKMNETILKMMIIQIPLLVVAIVCCFITPLKISSFGTALFWGIIINVIYNYLITKNLIADVKESK